ncbi:MAG: hypothetical protein K8F32_13125, partial [Rhodocyclaceae bacterium]|nr:hypothetical protein [Rhodocyclaceae bacterium]
VAQAVVGDDQVGRAGDFLQRPADLVEGGAAGHGQAALVGLLVQRGLAVAGGATFDEVSRALQEIARTPDLIVADYRLRDGENGVAAAQKLQQSFGAAIPVLLLTGESTHGGLEEAAASGFPVLRKPVTGARLLAEIDVLLGRNSVRGEAAGAPAR